MTKVMIRFPYSDSSTDMIMEKGLKFILCNRKYDPHMVLAMKTYLISDRDHSARKIYNITSLIATSDMSQLCTGGCWLLPFDLR
jgi:hypothetical protein